MTSNEQLRKSAISDLEWFFWQCESDLGIQSTYSSFIQACKYSTRHQDEVDLRAFVELCTTETTGYDILQATRKNRRILKNYQQLPSNHKVILEAYYQDRQYDQAITKDFGQGIGLIPYTEAGKALSKIALQNPDSPNDLLRKQYEAKKGALKKQTKALYEQALDAYIDILAQEKSQ